MYNNLLNISKTNKLYLLIIIKSYLIDNQNL